MPGMGREAEGAGNSSEQAVALSKALSTWAGVQHLAVPAAPKSPCCHVCECACWEAASIRADFVPQEISVPGQPELGCRSPVFLPVHGARGASGYCWNFVVNSEVVTFLS